MERRKRSSYAKTGPVLRIGSELEDKTGTMRAKLSRQQGFDGNSKDKCNKLDAVD